MKCDCEFVRQQLSAYIDGMLSDNEQAEISKHIAGCENCRGEYEFLQAISESAVTLPRLKVSDELHNRIMQTVLETPRKPVPKRPLWKLVSAAAATAAVIAVSVVSFSSLPGHPDLTTEDTPDVVYTADIVPENHENSKINDLQQAPKGRAAITQAPSPVQRAENENSPVEPASVPVEELPIEGNQSRSVPEVTAITDKVKNITLSIPKEQAQRVAEILSVYEKTEEGYRMSLEEKERVLAELETILVEESGGTEIVEFVIICE